MRRAQLEIFRTKAYELVVAFVDEDGNALPGFDTAGRTYRAFIRARATDTAVVATFDCTAESAYEVSLKLTVAESSKLELKDHVFDIEETAAGGEPAIICVGDVIVREPVTR